MKSWKKFCKGCLLGICFLIIVVSVTGCTRTFFVGLDPQSHFEYPNSNVIPLGRVVGEASKIFIFSPPLVTAEFQEEAINNALRQKEGSDILINYMEFQKITSFIFFTELIYRVEGTAAKMEIGTQELR